jgi:hypothetical protein
MEPRKKPESGGKQSSIRRLLFVGFFFGLLFYHEAGDSTVLRNIDRLLPNYMALHPRR